MEEIPLWLEMITRKRPEVAQVVYAMLSTGIRNGRTSAEDARGAATKYMRSCGFVKGAEFCGTTKASKGHSLHYWTLTDYSKAKGILDHLAKDLCDLPVRGQLNLL